MIWIFQISQFCSYIIQKRCLVLLLVPTFFTILDIISWDYNLNFSSLVANLEILRISVTIETLNIFESILLYRKGIFIMENGKEFFLSKKLEENFLFIVIFIMENRKESLLS